MALRPWQIAAQMAGVLNADSDAQNILSQAAQYESKATSLIPNQRISKPNLKLGTAQDLAIISSQQNKPNVALPRNNHGQVTTNPQPISLASGSTPGGNSSIPAAGTITNTRTFLPNTTVNGLSTGGTFLNDSGDMNIKGQPSMRLEEMSNGGARTILDRNSPYAKFMQTNDFAALRRIMQSVKSLAETLSAGTYKQKTLTEMGHPYATRHKGLKGIKQKKPRGIANLSVVNTQSGQFLTAWHTSVSKRADGVELKLYNNEDYAWYLAAGTRKMKAHGPFTAAMVKHIPQINLAWMGIASNAKRLYLQKAANDAAKSTFAKVAR